jgi:hypothetical protein
MKGWCVMLSSIRKFASKVLDVLTEYVNTISSLLKPEEPKFVDVPMGFDSETPVEPGSSVRIITRPQVPFRGSRLVISKTCLDFTINDLCVGRNSQFVSAQNLPAEAFSAPMGSELKLETAQIAQDVVLVVTNHGNEPVRFVAAMFGRALVG